MSLPGVNPRDLALTVLKQKGGEELLIHKGNEELRSISLANDLIEQADGDTISGFLAPDERAAQLTRGIVSLVGGDFKGFYAQEWARFRADCEPEDVLPYVDLSVSEWNDQKLTWAERYDVDADPEEIAERHVEAVFGVELDEFVAEVVAWADADEGETVRRFFAGDSYHDEWRIFTGHLTAHEGMEWAIGELFE